MSNWNGNRIIRKREAAFFFYQSYVKDHHIVRGIQKISFTFHIYINSKLFFVLSNTTFFFLNQFSCSNIELYKALYQSTIVNVNPQNIHIYMMSMKRQKEIIFTPHQLPHIYTYECNRIWSQNWYWESLLCNICDEYDMRLILLFVKRTNTQWNILTDGWMYIVTWLCIVDTI